MILQYKKLKKLKVKLILMKKILKIMLKKLLLKVKKTILVMKMLQVQALLKNKMDFG